MYMLLDGLDWFPLLLPLGTPAGSFSWLLPRRMLAIIPSIVSLYYIVSPSLLQTDVYYPPSPVTGD